MLNYLLDNNAFGRHVLFFNPLTMKHKIEYKTSEKQRKGKRDYYLRNRARMLAYAKKYQIEHYDKQLQRKRDWIKAYPEDWREYNRNKMRDRYHNKEGERERQFIYAKKYNEKNRERLRIYHRFYKLYSRIRYVYCQLLVQSNSSINFTKGGDLLG